MAVKTFRAYTPSRRYITVADFSDLTKNVRPLKSLILKKSRSGGRNNNGRNTSINTGGGHKQRYRIIDFKRNKFGIEGTVATIEYDPNRTARIALVHYADGEKRYMLAPATLVVGQKVMSGEKAEIRIGNCLPLRNIPVGESIHNIEVKLGKGGQLVRSAGLAAQLVAKENDYGMIRLPSGELRKIHLNCLATVGILTNGDHKNICLGKAGRSRWLGIRPHNRGVTKNPVDHPMGGGEGRSSGGRHPCSPNGLPAKGYKTRHNKRTDKFIVRGRNKKS